MRRTIVAVAAVACMLAGGTPAAGDPSFTRAANTEGGRLVFESGEATLTFDSTDVWEYAGQDILPFDYEQGVAFTGEGLVFSSRGALVRTTLGCPDPLDDEEPCYDEVVERPFGISADEFEQGFNHIGDIDVGLAGDAQGFVLAPLETSSRGGTCPQGPRLVRGYKAYRVSDLSTAGRFIETNCHRNHSWVTVDLTGHWLLAADPGTQQDDDSFAQTIRVLEIARDGAEGSANEISITPQPGKNINVTSSQPLPNYAGCAFLGATTLYCSDWLDDNDIDIATRIYRIDLFGGAVGTSGVTGQGTQILSLELEPKYTGVQVDEDEDAEPIVPFGNETEGITFYRRSVDGSVEMHVLLRGETLGWFYYVHLEPVPPPSPSA